MNLQEIVQQYHGATLPKLIEKQIKSLNEDTLLQAIQGMYRDFPIEFRKQVDAFTHAYVENWLAPHMVTTDLGDIFSDTVQDIKVMATQSGVSLTDEQVFTVFNLIALKVSYFAHINPEFRRSWGIKKGWFS